MSLAIICSLAPRPLAAVSLRLVGGPTSVDAIADTARANAMRSMPSR
jgi:hypothetical protein